jgi:tRNA dimethylallyltransferase
MPRPRILVIAGPTASGKTAAAITLARRLRGELVGCDSVQVYRGFDIGSAKPTAAELDGVAHHLIDVVNPDEPIDAMSYAARADRAIEGIAARGRVPIVVGGTGLWMRALLRGLVHVPPPDPAIREALAREVDARGAPALHARLQALDPRAAAAIHPHDALRIVRALEVHAQTGRPLGELRAAHALGKPRYPAWVVALECPREELDARIDARIDAMLAAGWADEVRALLARWGPDVRPFGSIGYREILAHVKDGVPLEEARRRVRRSTRMYARRQRTWLAGDPDVAWRASAEALLGPEGMARLEAFLGGKEPPPAGAGRRA